MLALVVLTGCLQGFEDRLDQRVVEMRDHEIDAFVALEAVHRGDLLALRQAGTRLAKLDAVPGLPDHLRPMLDGVRAEGATLAEVTGWPEVAPPLARLAARCGGCHELSKVRPVGPRRDLPLEEAFFAVAFREEARWGRAQSALAPAGAEQATTWAERQQVLLEALQARVDDHGSP